MRSTLLLLAISVSVVAVVESCGAAPCNAKTCSGCCDVSGKCQTSSNNTCGNLGALCSSCQIGQTCLLGTCSGGMGAGNGGGTAGTGGGTTGTGGGTGGGTTGTGGGAGGGVAGGAGGGAGGGGACVARFNGCVTSPECCSGMVCTSQGYCDTSATGGGAGGGGGSCSGCRTGASCLALSSQSSSACGINGQSCVSCSSGQTCVSGVCTGGGGLPTGSACSSSTQCQSGDSCRFVTNGGNASYPSGVCTRACTGPGSCASGAICLGGLEPYGEVEVCMPACSTGSCRTGYTCYTLGDGSQACWLATLPSGGSTPTNVGVSCSSDSTCQNPPAFGGRCLLSTDGYPSGYCSRACADNTWCTSGTTSLCLDTNNGPLCHLRCSFPGTTSGCRSSYVCAHYFSALPDGGSTPSTDGYCAPDCRVSSICDPSQTCGTNGECQ